MRSILKKISIFLYLMFMIVGFFACVGYFTHQLDSAKYIIAPMVTGLFFNILYKIL